MVSGRVHAWVCSGSATCRTPARSRWWCGSRGWCVPSRRVGGGRSLRPRAVAERARCTTRLRTAVLAAVIDSGRAVAEVAADYGVAWWTVQATVNAAAVLLPDVDELHVRRLGIDEHRYRRVRWFRDEHGGWRRVEPWMSTIVNADTGQVLGIVDGRDSAAVGGWLAARSQAWRDRIEVVAIDPSAAFKKAITEQLPGAHDQRRPVPSGAAGEPDGDPGPAAAGPRAGAPPRPEGRPGLGAPHTAAPRLRHPLRPRPKARLGRCSPPTTPPTSCRPPGA